MSKEEFTPGDWKAVVNEPLEDDFICDVYDEHNNCICECFSREYWGNKKGITEKQKEANMHLISAAPGMYRVLQGICFEKSARICNYAPESCGVCAIKKALKKARGEE